MENTAKKPAKQKLLVIFLCIGMVFSLAFSTISMMGYTFTGLYYAITGKNDDYDDDYVTEELGTAKENDVTIATQYTVLSTENISEAYRTGDSSTLSEQDKETLTMASDVLKEIITDKMTPYEKEKAVYDWMCANITNDVGSQTVIPTAGETSDRPYGVLKTHQAVCVGYATTFRLFMEMLDIPCHVVHNSELYHTWNEVQLDNQWYITDVYSDAGYGNYQNFNVSDTVYSISQSWDTKTFPAAVGLTYNVAYQNRETSDDLYAVAARLRQAVDGKESFISMQFGQLTDEEQSAANTIVEQIGTILWNNRRYQNYSLTNRWMDTDEGKLLVVYLQEYHPIDEVVIDDEKESRIEQAVSEAFGDLENGSSTSGNTATGTDCTDMTKEAVLQNGGSIVKNNGQAVG